jgi:hypothetical protein
MNRFKQRFCKWNWTSVFPIAFLATYKFKNSSDITNVVAAINLWKYPK